jgi:PAS domain S-box-containing protein
MQEGKSSAVRYGVMLLSISLAFALTTLLPQLRERESFLVFIGAVAVSAWFGGRGPGVWACALSAIITNYFIYEPRFSFSLDLEVIVSHIVFIIVAIMISSFTAQLQMAEERMRQQRHWFEHLLSSIGDAVLAADAQGKVTFINAAASQLFEKNTAAATGMTVHEYMSVRKGRDSDDTLLLIQETLRGERTVTHSDPMTLQRSNSEALIEYTMAPIKSALGRMEGVVLAVRDVTERETARLKIMAYQEDLRALATELSLAEERERRQLAETLHDRVSQSLALTNIKLQTMRDKIGNDELIEEFDAVSRLMKEILAETRSLTFELSPPILYEFGLEAALEWLCQHFEKTHRLKCSFHNGTVLPAVNQNIRIALYQAVRELLTNAVKHASATHLTVGVKSNDNQLHVFVSDDGKGMENPKAVSATRSPQGYGLFSVRERIRSLGGEIALTSSPGKGTSVSLKVPLAV